MSVNKLKQQTEEKPLEKRPVRRKPSSGFSNSIMKFMNMFGIFSRNQVVNMMPFILFLTILLIGYIGNSYYAEHLIREIDKTKHELKEKRAQYISVMSKLMYQSNQSEVARSLEQYQIKETIEPPDKIFISEVPAK